MVVSCGLGFRVVECLGWLRVWGGLEFGVVLGLGWFRVLGGLGWFRMV